MRPLHDEHHSTTACNDADSRPTLRTGVRGIYLATPLDAEARAKVQTGLLSCLQPHPLGALHRDAMEVFARWADDGSLWQAFVASVRHLAVEQQLDLRVLHGDGTNTVAKKGAMALDSRGINTRRGT